MYSKTPSWIQNGGHKNTFSTPFELETPNFVRRCMTKGTLRKYCKMLKTSPSWIQNGCQTHC